MARKMMAKQQQPAAGEATAPQVNPNDVAAAGVQALQSAITILDALKRRPNADPEPIDGQIDALQAQQAALRSQVLRAIDDFAANKQAITAMNAAAAALDTEAAIMQATAADLTDVAKVVAAATLLAATLAPFL